MAIFAALTAQDHELFADRNRVSGCDQTQHPEFAIARWAASNLSEQQRATATVYTSGEHCPMFAAAHALVGLGRIVYASSSAQLSAWHAEWNIPAGPVAPMPIHKIAPGIEIAGPDTKLSGQVKKPSSATTRCRPYLSVFNQRIHQSVDKFKCFLTKFTGLNR